MGFLSRLRAAPRRQRNGAAFPAADITRLTSSWTSDPGSINRWLRHELRTLRARSRQLARGDAYGAKFIASCVQNIAGPTPFNLQAKFKIGDRIHSDANDAVETAWKEAGKPGNCEVTGRLSRGEFDRLVVRCMARDGEALIRTVRGGPQFGGGSGVRQLIDIDRLDEMRNDNLSGGGSIKLGVELDAYSKPVAYWLLRQHPGEIGEWSRGTTREHERVPADQIRHLFIPDWPEQVRGFPWMHAAMVRLWHLGGFEEAAVINARIGASKVATIETTGPDASALATQEATGKDAQGNFLTDIEPGQYWQLPLGATLGKFDPAFPDASVGPFIQACLRGAAAAVGMAYHSLANDPSSVNFSTARIALLEERAMWMTIQNWYVEHFTRPDFEDWMRGAILDGMLPQAYWGHRDEVRFQPTRWDWVDPKSDTFAKIEQLNAKLTSRTRIAAERGDDIEDIFDELAEEERLAAEKDIELAPATPVATKPGAQPDAAPQDQSTA